MLHFLPIFICLLPLFEGNELNRIGPAENEKIQQFCGNTLFTGDLKPVNGLILGGTEANIGSYPWAAALFIESIGNVTYNTALCGGTLISQRHVLTARHCILDVFCAEKRKGAFAKWWVQVGGLCTKVDATQNCTQMDMLKVPVRRAIYSSEFSTSDSDCSQSMMGTQEKMESDLVIIELAQDLQPVPFGPNDWPQNRIQVGCLPNQEQFAKELHIYGWGNTRRDDEQTDESGVPEESEPSAHLMETELPVVGPDDPLHNYPSCQSKRLVCAHSRQSSRDRQLDGAMGDSGTGIVGIHGRQRLIEAITCSGNPTDQLNIGLLLFPLLREICFYTGVCQLKEWAGVVNERSQMEATGPGQMLKMDTVYEYRGGPIQ